MTFSTLRIICDQSDVSSGAGKTSLLEATIRQLKDDYRIGVIEGDLVTTIDADRITAMGVPAYQITTGSVCHLDARMVHNASHGFDVTIQSPDNRKCRQSGVPGGV